jgi:hypothetical protein
VLLNRTTSSGGSTAAGCAVLICLVTWVVSAPTFCAFPVYVSVSRQSKTCGFGRRILQSSTF